MVLRIVVGLVMTVAAAAIASRRLWRLGRLGRAVQPAPDRVAAVRSHPERDVEVQASEVFGQRKLLKWSIPGLAHLFTSVTLRRPAPSDGAAHEGGRP